MILRNKIDTTFNKDEVRALLELLYKLESHLERAGSKNRGIITGIIQSLNEIGIK